MIMTVNNIFDFLNNLFPTDTACDFDNVGLLIGDGEKEVKKAVVTLDCTSKTVEFAYLNDCQLIITHHPVIFSPLKRVLKGDICYELISKDISVISMHTNLDIGQNGVNDSLCEAINLRIVETFTAADGFALRCGEINPTDADVFALNLKKSLNTTVKFVDGGRKISKVLVCSGSGGDYLPAAENGGFDALITADVKHHQFLFAKERGISLFDCGHFETENVVIEPLKQALQKEFAETIFFSFSENSIKYL